MATKTTVRRMARYDAEQIRAAMSAARSQGATSVEYVSGLHIVGGASDQVLRRKTACRLCGEDMLKGGVATQFAYRYFPDSHPYRITESFVHPERCR